MLAEHWLWPFELPKLDSIVPGFQGIGVSYTRLMNNQTLEKDVEELESSGGAPSP